MTSQTAPPANLRLIGGEMLVWSDEPAAQTAGAAAGIGAVLAALVTRAVPSGGHVLVAGAHPHAVLDALVARAGRVTCLVRGYPDASALARAYAEQPAIDVLAGSLSRLPTGERFDAVVALTGLDRVCSAEIDELDWDGTLDRLLAVLRPGGALLLALENPMGLHRLVSLDPGHAGRDDAVWAVPGGPDPSCPTSLARLRERLAGRGTGVEASYAAYPLLDQPAVLIDPALLEDSAAPAGQMASAPAGQMASAPAGQVDAGLSGQLDAALAAAYAGGAALGVQLRDPRPLARGARRTGLAASLAPAWVVVARRTDGVVPERDLPVLLSVDGEGRRWRALAELTSGPDGWARHGSAVPADPAGKIAPTGLVRRDPQQLTGPAPPGALLDELLLDACLRRDQPELRRLLSGYAAWLTRVADAERRLPGGYAFATPANVVVAAGRFAVLDPSWHLTEPLPLDVALARGLRQFAVTMVTGGHAHPWASTLDVDGLTVVLAGLAGNPVDRDVVAAAIRAEASIGAAVDGLTEAQRSALVERLRRITVTDPLPGLDSYEQLREAWQRQREELIRLADRLSWSEKILDSREHALRKAQLTIGMLSGSLSFRVGRLLITPARLAKRGFRAIRRRLRRLRHRVAEER